MRITEGAVLLEGYAADAEPQLLAALEAVIAAAPLRHMSTPGGQRMSVSMTNCGTAGWVSDRSGYRYQAVDPDSQRPWPAMPAAFAALAGSAAARAGFAGFTPDACLVNCYVPGAKMGLHQDRDERDFAAPIVSVSLGLPAIFLFGGARRSDRPQRIALAHGDVVVWGGPARLAFHGVAKLAAGEPAGQAAGGHAWLGNRRINLTFRRAL